MPKNGLRQTFKLKTRGMSEVDCEIGITIEGRELPNMAVLGGALEDAVALVQTKVTESYKVVPERVEQV